MPWRKRPDGTEYFDLGPVVNTGGPATAQQIQPAAQAQQIQSPQAPRYTPQTMPRIQPVGIFRSPARDNSFLSKAGSVFKNLAKEAIFSVGFRPTAAGETPEEAKAAIEQGYDSEAYKTAQRLANETAKARGVITKNDPISTIVAPAVEAGVNLSPLRVAKAGLAVKPIVKNAALFGAAGAVSGVPHSVSTDTPLLKNVAEGAVGGAVLGGLGTPVVAGAKALGGTAIRAIKKPEATVRVGTASQERPETPINVPERPAPSKPVTQTPAQKKPIGSDKVDSSVVRQGGGIDIEASGAKVAQANKDAVSSELSTFEKVRRRVGRIGDDRAFAERVDRTVRKLTGKQLPSRSLSNALSSQRDSSTAVQQRLDDEGFSALVQKIAGEPGKTLDGFDLYTKALHGMERASKLKRPKESLVSAFDEVAGKATGITYREAQEIIRDGAARYGGDASALTGILKRDLERRVKDGSIGEEARTFIDQFETYVPFDRHFSEDWKHFSRSRTPGSASLEAKRRAGRSEREIQNVLENARARLARTTEKGLQNRVAGIVADDIRNLPGNPLKVEAVRTAEDVIGRRAIWKELAKSKPVRDKLVKMLKRANKNINSIEKELNELSKRGVRLSLKSDSSPDSPSGKVVDTLSKTGIVTSNQVRQLVKDLINQDPSGLKSVRNQISSREPKLAQLIDDASTIETDLAKVKRQRLEKHNEAMKILDKDKTGQNYITRLKEGVNEQYTVGDPDLYDVVTSPGHRLEGGMKAVSIPTRVVRVGTTGPANVKFQAVTTAVKAPISQILHAEYAARNFDPRNIVKGIVDTLREVGERPSQFSQELRRGGGTRSWRVEQFRNETTETVEGIASSRSIKARAEYLARNPELALREIENKTSAPERLWRNIAARARYAGETSTWWKSGKPMSHKEAIEAAKRSYREEQVDFSRSSQTLQNINVFAQLINAAVQGGRRLGRDFLERPVRTPLRLAAVSTPVVASMLWNLGSEERAKMYNEIPEWERESNTIFIPPWAKRDDKGNFPYMKLPDAPDIKMLLGGIRKAMNSEYQADPKSFYDAAARGVSSFTGIDVTSARSAVSQFAPAALKGAIEDITNTNLFTGKEIVPEDEAYRIKKEGYASGTAKWLGEKLNVSPLRVQNFLNATFGPGSKYVESGFTDKVVSMSGAEDATKNDVSVWNDIKRAFYNPEGGKSNGQKFFENSEQVRESLKAPGDPNDPEVGKRTDELRTAYDLYLAKSVEKGDPWYTQEFSTLLLGHPEVVEKLSELYKKQDNHDPFWDLTPDQQKQVLIYRHFDPHGYSLGSPAEEAQKDVIQGASWYQDFKKQQNKYFDNLPQDVKDKIKEEDTGTAVPRPSETVEQKLDAYNSIADKNLRSDFLKANPDVSEYFTEVNKGKQVQRQNMGLLRDVTPTQETAINEYYRLKNAGLSTKGFTKAHPGLGTYFDAMHGIKDQAGLLVESVGGPKAEVSGTGSGGGKRGGRGGGAKVKRIKAKKPKISKAKSPRSSITARKPKGSPKARRGGIKFSVSKVA